MVKIRCLRFEDYNFLFGFIWGVYKSKGSLSCADLKNYLLEDKSTMKMFGLKNSDDYFQLLHLAEKDYGWDMEGLSKIKTEVHEPQMKGASVDIILVLPDPNVMISPTGDAIKLEDSNV